MSYSESAEQPAEFYLLSYPAHASYPAMLIRGEEQPAAQVGTPEHCNQRRITRLIHLEGTQSAQVVMGYTRLAAGSVWNTMPPHSHARRSEIYLYFDLPEAERVVHLMGPQQQTRHLLVKNKQAVISPGWSIHGGVGTQKYSFCWGMGGENQVYSDMEPGFRRTAMETDNTEALRADPTRSRQILERIPAARWGKPQDLAGATLFLASPASDYVHGHILAVDGGWLAR